MLRNVTFETSRGVILKIKIPDWTGMHFKVEETGHE
jgi:hypothetical protein